MNHVNSVRPFRGRNKEGFLTLSRWTVKLQKTSTFITVEVGMDRFPVGSVTHRHPGSQKATGVGGGVVKDTFA